MSLRPRPRGAARNEVLTEREGRASPFDSQLIVRDGGLAHFRQGAGDEVVPLDTQALGVIYARFIGGDDLAKQVYEYAQQNFAIGDRSIALSDDRASYNMTYEASGPFNGYRPYIGKGAPDVLWFEGTAEMRLHRASSANRPKHSTPA